MAEIEWEKLTPTQYEDLVSVLLSHMNPRIRRVDGKGGDAGRDSEFLREGGPEIFQLKSFTGRMNAGRRRKVEASLEKAAQRNLVAWHLVVPIDPTPGETQWFDGLQTRYAFPLSWDGRTWLDSHIAERLFIPRYFLEGDSDRVLEMLKELSQEKAAIRDIHTGLDRMRVLANRLNELDPYYRFDVSIRDQAVEVGIMPRYEGAELDRPITFNVHLVFPQTEEGLAAADEFKSAMDFGSPVDVKGQYIEAMAIDAPAGLADSFSEGGSLSIGPPQPADEWTLGVVLSVVNVDDIPLAELPVILNERTSGRRGAVMKGTDRANALDVSMKLDLETQVAQLSFKFSSTSSHYPHDLLPAVTFVSNMVEPNRIRVLLGDDRVPLGETLPVPNGTLIEEEYVDLIRRLAKVQQATGTYFTMPVLFSPEDLRQLAEASDLLEGKEVTKTWNDALFALTAADPVQLLEQLRANSGAGTYAVEGDATAEIAGHSVPLGKMRTSLLEARVANLTEVAEVLQSAEVDSPVAIEVKLEALGDKTLRTSLVREREL